MKPRFFFLELAALFILSINSFAQIVEQDYARKIALNTFSELSKGSGAAIVTGDSVIYDDRNQPLLYIFKESKGGFIILSADKRAYPLLGWGDPGSSLPGNSNLPPPLAEMIESWKSQIVFCRDANIPPSGYVSEMWSSLEKGELPALSGAKAVLPLLATRWSQGCGYNALCPVDAAGPCGRALTGCVATAMAQVIRYRQHPATGTGSKCYTTSRYGEICADFSDGTYDYAAMSNTSGNAAVAKLIFHCGVSVSMNYGPSASSASSGSVASAMRTYFDYTNGLILSKSAYPEANWASLLRSELDGSRPLYYSGYGTVGHAFVLDGYQDENYFHVNWGWGGSYDGYFYLSSLNPGGMSFTSGQQAIIGMIPVSQFTGLDFASSIVLDCKTPVHGDLSDGVDYVNYYRNIYPATPGKELVYKFTTVLPGRIRIKITNQSGSVYTFLLNHACKDSVLTYGINGLIADNTNPGTYYVAVESQDYSEPQFTIEAICPSPDADLDINSATVSPGYIQSLQTNVRLSSTISNIGKSAAGSCLLEYYLSNDIEFSLANDIFLGSRNIPALDPGAGTALNSVLTMPGNLLSGNYYVLFVADRENIVPEADEENVFRVSVTVPVPGLLDCSSSIALTDNHWHYGNTLTDGVNWVDKYLMSSDMTGPEVVHTFVPVYNGIANISFVDKSPGILYAFILPVCNENTGEQPIRLYNLTDTLATAEIFVSAGTQYYIVADGYKGASGDYGLLVKLPGECPEAKIESFGNTDMCNGDPYPGFRTTAGQSSYQWYRDGSLIRGAVYNYYNPNSTGTYYVAISENGCNVVSAPVTVRSDPSPDTAMIVAADTTGFCPGGSVLLKLGNIVGNPLNWARNDLLIPGATGSAINASLTGSYSLYTINGACKVKSSNSIDVTVPDPPVNLHETIPFPSDKVRFFERFDSGGGYEGGSITQKFSMMGWDYEPIDDRFGNFWKARYLMGEDEFMYWSGNDTISDDFTLALWFKTTTGRGGVIAEFAESPWNPVRAEAVLYMSDNGKLNFWLSNAGTPAELKSVSSYNDGVWHFIMISHDGKMNLGIDDGAEMITSAGTVSKEAFTGNWTFGGSFLPVSVSRMPSSKFFMGAIDDILCLDESNRYTTQYMFRQPKLDVSITEDLPVCVPASLSLRMPFAQKGVEYKLWERIRSAWGPESAISDGGPVQFGNAEVQLGRNEFQVVARDLADGCETVLDTVIVAEVWSHCTLIPDDQGEGGLRVYPVPAGEVLHFESAAVITEVTISDSNGKLVYIAFPAENNFEISIGTLAPAVYFYQLRTREGSVLTGRFIVSH